MPIKDESKDLTHHRQDANSGSTPPSNLVSFFSGKVIERSDESRVIALHPELNGIKMLYKNSYWDTHSISVPILAWAQRHDGGVVALVPWVDQVLQCEAIAVRYNIHFEAYYNDKVQTLFLEPPRLEAELLKTHLKFSERDQGKDNSVIHEFNDQIGTHALLFDEEQQALILQPVISWQLLQNGQVDGMLADESKAHKLPILVGDSCLYACRLNQNFRCYIQRDIAEQIRDRDPETLNAIEQML